MDSFSHHARRSGIMPMAEASSAYQTCLVVEFSLSLQSHTLALPMDRVGGFLPGQDESCPLLERHWNILEGHGYHS